MLAPLGAQAADLVVWWEKGFNPEEEKAVREIVGAFEQETGKQVEVSFHPEGEHPDPIVAARCRPPPDFAFGSIAISSLSQWALDDRLVDLTDTVGPFSNLFDPDALACVDVAQPEDGAAGTVRAAYGADQQHVHVWKSLLERAGFTLADIPKEWDAFWSFWCDQVQPAVRQAPGRDDIWGVGYHVRHLDATRSTSSTSSCSPTRQTTSRREGRS